MNQPFQIWLENITGPVRLSEALVTSLQRGKSVLFLADPDMPWRWQFRGNVESKLSNDFTVRIIDCEEEYNGEDIGEFLVSRLAPDSFSAYLRQRGNKSKYLKSSGIFSNTVIWIKGVGEQPSVQWTRYVSDYCSRSRQDGLFIIEINQYLDLPKAARNNMEVIDYSDFITRQDLQLFTSIIAASNEEIPAYLKQYVACVSACLCGTDAELADKLISNSDFSRIEPVDALEKLFDEGLLPNFRGIVCAPENPHPFALLRKGLKSDLEKRVWTAQLQVAFPAIELERAALITKWKFEIEEAIGTQYWSPATCSAEYITQYGEQLQSPYDAEIGTLVRMTQLRKDKDRDQYLLYIPEEVDRDRLQILRGLRNNLAHLKTCAPNDINELFKT
jgi:hypothetical protein